jgi:hypothetical protein
MQPYSEAGFLFAGSVLVDINPGTAFMLSRWCKEAQQAQFFFCMLMRFCYTYCRTIELSYFLSESQVDGTDKRQKRTGTCSVCIANAVSQM